MSTLINPKQIEGWAEMLADLGSIQDVLGTTEEEVEDISSSIEELSKKILEF